MAQLTNELIHEILKSLQAGQAEIRADHTLQLIRVREEINALRSDDLRRESLRARMETRPIEAP